MKNLSAFVSILLVAYATSKCDFKSDWEYRLEWINFNTTNEDALSAAIRTVRLDRSIGRKGVNGTMTIGTPLDSNYRVNLVIEVSQGSGYYRKTPFEYKDFPFYDFMNELYKNQLMDELHRCAGQQLFEKCTEPVMPHKVILDKCYFKFGCFISHLNPGFYRFTLELKGPTVTFVGQAVTRIDNI